MKYFSDNDDASGIAASASNLRGYSPKLFGVDKLEKSSPYVWNQLILTPENSPLYEDYDDSGNANVRSQLIPSIVQYTTNLACQPPGLGMRPSVNNIHSSHSMVIMPVNFHAKSVPDLRIYLMTLL